MYRNERELRHSALLAPSILIGLKIIACIAEEADGGMEAQSWYVLVRIQLEDRRRVAGRVKLHA